MRTPLLIFSLILWALLVNGQINTGNIGLEIARMKHLEFFNDVKQIAGSPYLDEKFQKSYISKVNGAEINDIQLRYNLYNDQMEFKEDGTIFSIALPNEVVRINMGGKIFIYKPYMTTKNVKAGFFQVMYDGDYQLLKKYKVVLSSPSEKTHLDDSLRFERKLPQFYMRYGDGMAHLVYSQKTLIKVLQPIPQKVIDFIKSNKVNTRDEKQLVDLMEYMDQSEN